MTLPNTTIERRRLLTKNLTPGKTFFEQEYTVGNKRVLDPRHSKLAAAAMKGCQQFGLAEGSVVLYLGASHGYTPSFVSDMIGKDGTIFCVEFSPSVCRDLVFVCKERENMIPILADANQPDTYKERITKVDVLFQDIAQKNQVDIFLKNLRAYVIPGGFGMLALKARSVDVTRRPDDIFKEVRKQFENADDFVIIDYRELAPLEKDHAFFVVKRKA